MGLTCDDDIQEEMLSLIGPEALKLTIVPKEHRSNRVSITNQSDTDGMADESSVNQSTGTLDPEAQKVLNKLKQKQQKKKKAIDKRGEYNSDSSEGQPEGIEGSDDDYTSMYSTDNMIMKDSI